MFDFLVSYIKKKTIKAVVNLSHEYFTQNLNDKNLNLSNQKNILFVVSKKIYSFFYIWNLLYPKQYYHLANQQFFWERHL